MTWPLTLAALLVQVSIENSIVAKKLNNLKDPSSLKPHPKTISKFGTKNELYFTPGIGKQRGGTEETLYQINMDLVTSLRVN